MGKIGNFRMAVAGLVYLVSNATDYFDTVNHLDYLKNREQERSLYHKKEMERLKGIEKRVNELSKELDQIEKEQASGVMEKGSKLFYLTREKGKLIVNWKHNGKKVYWTPEGKEIQVN